MIKMIQLRGTDQLTKVEAAEEERLSGPHEYGSEQWAEQAAELIKNMYHRGGFKGQEVISCLPGEKLKIKSLRLDAEYPEEIEEVIRTDVAKRFELNPEEDEIRYLIAGNAYQGSEIKNEVIFFGMQRDDLENHILLLEKAGLFPVSLDTVPTALCRCFQSSLRRREDQDLVSVYVDLGTRFTTVIIGRGQEIAFIKQIPIAGQELNEQVASRLGISIEEATELRDRMRQTSREDIEKETRRAVVDAMNNSIESLAHEISLCFRYYAVTFRGQRPTQAAFAGGEAYESALMDALKKHLGVNICIAEPLRGFDVSQVDFDQRPNPQMSEWAIVVGLALRGIQLDDNMPQTIKTETAVL